MLTRRKKFLLAAACLLALSQTPFIYRRYRLGRLAATVKRLNAARPATPADDSFTDYKGVFHVHSALSHDSTGRPEEIVAAARRNGLDFVVMTEHASPRVDPAASGLNGTRGGVLFVAGSELNAPGGERLFVVPGVPPPPPIDMTTRDYIGSLKDDGRLVLVAYPEQVRDWSFEGYDGLEVYNLYTNAKRINYALLFFDGLWSYWSYPELLFSTFYERPDANLKRWDELNATGRRASAVAGTDAHQNVGFDFGNRSSERIFNVKLDPYERSFRVVRQHVLLARDKPLNAGALLDALARGHSYIAFDLFCDAAGFRFTAESASERRMMGDDITLPAAGGVRLAVSLPVEGRVRFYRDGVVLHEEADVLRKELTIEREGVYRVEVYLDALQTPLSEKPWIISNPIYVRSGGR